MSKQHRYGLWRILTFSRKAPKLPILSMPNKHAAMKDLRKNRKHAAKNARMKIHVKALTHQLSALLKEGKAKDASEVARKLQQALDKSAKNHVVHANKAARKKAQSAKQLATKK